MEPSETRWERHHSNFTLSLHLVSFCQLCIPQNCVLAHNYISTRHSAVLIAFTYKTAISSVFSSNTPTRHTNSAQLMRSTASTYKTDHMHLPCSVAITLQPLTTRLILHAYQHMHYTPRTTHPTAFYNPPMHTNHKHKALLPK